MNAFAQAPLEEEIYMKIPRDFTAADVDNKYVLKMNKSLYRSRQALLSWFEHLKKHFEGQGFVSMPFCEQDNYNIFLVYIDNVIWVAPD